MSELCYQTKESGGKALHEFGGEDRVKTLRRERKPLTGVPCRKFHRTPLEVAR